PSALAHERAHPRVRSSVLRDSGCRGTFRHCGARAGCPQGRRLARAGRQRDRYCLGDARRARRPVLPPAHRGGRMTMSGGARGGAPRLVTKILGFSFGVIALVRAAVFLLLSWQTRDRLTQAIAANMAVSQQRVADREAARQRDDRQQAATLAEHPTLKAAVDTYHSENSMGGATPQLLNTIRAELEKVRQNTRVPALAVTDVRGVILASTGVNAGDWRDGDQVAIDDDLALEPVATVMARGDRVYLATVVPFLFGRDAVGDLILASPIDDGYARNLAQDAQADVVVLRHGRAIATSL